MSATTLHKAARFDQSGAGSRWIAADAAAFRHAFNRSSFAIRHGLATHPLFELTRLAQVAEKLRERGDRDKFVALGASATETGTKFTKIPRLAAVPDSVRHLGESGSWIKLSHVNQVDADYKTLMEELLEDLEQLSGRMLRQEITWPILTIFLASPGITTPYHIDHESNFLMQVRGEKDVCLFDGTDRSILSEEEIERFYSGNAEAACYRDDLAQRGTVYRLTAGVGVHHPPLAPHWVRNGDAISVSVSLGFCLRSTDRTAKVYQANLILRRLGLHPMSPGHRTVGDKVKVAAIGLVSKRHPASRSEMLFSGVRRLATPLAAARRLRGGNA